jgi:hypothetical protein
VDTSNICKALALLQTRRKLAISSVNRQTNAVTAFVRTTLGFSTFMQEAERDKIAARARRIVAAAMSGKPQSADDVDHFLLVEADIAVCVAALKPFQLRRNEIEKEMRELATSLPVWSTFALGVKGFGPTGLAVMIAETGDLNNYPNFRKVWKRLGLMPYEGKACSTWRSKGGMPEGGWEKVGYSPRRRAEIYGCVADSMSKHQCVGAKKSDTEFGVPKGPYGKVYVARREKTKIDHPDWTKAHSNADALRIMTKSLVADLWSVWRGEHRTELSAMSRLAPLSEESEPGEHIMILSAMVSVAHPVQSESQREHSAALSAEKTIALAASEMETA